MYWNLFSVHFLSLNLLRIRFEVLGDVYELSMGNRVAYFRRVKLSSFWVRFVLVIFQVNLDGSHNGRRHGKENHCVCCGMN
jgi:hypothetical protein